MVDYLIIAKGFMAVLYYFEVLYFGLLPGRQGCPTQLFLALGAGLFISIAILHILPEANESIHNYIVDHYGQGDQYPYAFLIVVAVFCLIFSVNVMVVGQHSHSHGQQEEENRESLLQEEEGGRVVSPVVLQVGIAIHALFEGLGIGVQTHLGPCLGLSLAVAIHKWAEGMTLGIKFRQAGYSPNLIKIFLLLQATVNPLGILLGDILTTTNELVEAIVVSVSAGTFLYVGAAEMLVESFEHPKKRALKVLLLNIGVAIVAALWFVESAFE